MVGTHSEGGRNMLYLRKVLDTLLANGVVPILSTKADNREGDHQVNLEMAELAAEYNIPLWNFWPVPGDLPGPRAVHKEPVDRYLGNNLSDRGSACAPPPVCLAGFGHSPPDGNWGLESGEQ